MALLWTTTLINTVVIITFGTAIWPGHSTNMWSLFGRRPALNLWKYNVILRNQCMMNKDLSPSVKVIKEVRSPSLLLSIPEQLSWCLAVKSTHGS